MKAVTETQSPILPSSVSASKQQKTKEENRELAAVDMPTVSSPAITLLFSLPSLISSLVNCIKQKKHESMAAYIVKLISLPTGVASVVFAIMAFIIPLLFGTAVPVLLMLSAALGILFLTIEIVMEAIRLGKILCFRSQTPIHSTMQLVEKINQDIKLGKSPETIYEENALQIHKIVQNATTPSSIEELKDLRKQILITPLKNLHEKFCTISEAELLKIKAAVSKKAGLDEQSQKDLIKSKKQTLLLIKTNHLARRVGARMTQFLKVHLPMLIEKTSKSRFIKECYIKLREQVNKSTLVYILGLVALTVSLIALSFLLGTFPFFVPIVMTAVGFVLEFIRAHTEKAFIEQDGYKWKWKAMLPSFLGGENPLKQPPITIKA